MRYRNIWLAFFIVSWFPSVQAQNVFDLPERARSIASDAPRSMPILEAKPIVEDSITSISGASETPMDTSRIASSSSSRNSSLPAPADESDIMQIRSTTDEATVLTSSHRDSLNPFDLSERSASASTKNKTTAKPTRRQEKKKEADTLLPDDTSRTDTSQVSISDLASQPDPEVTEDSRVTEVFSTEGLGDLSVEDPQAGNQTRKVLLFWVLLSLALLSSIVIYLEREMVLNLFKALNNNNFLNLLQRKRNQNTNIIYSILYVLFLVNAGVFLYLVWQHYIGILPWHYLFYFILGPLVVYSVKHMVILGLGWIYRQQKIMGTYSFSMVVFNCVLGLLFLPINFFGAFSSMSVAKVSLMIGLILWGSLLILRSLRLTLTALPVVGGRNIQFLLYLCTVELMPLGVLWKYLA